MKREISYYIYNVCGNYTALVEGLNFSNEIKKIINDRIIEANKKVEQVGFIQKCGEYKLIMAGGEFCGNAIRSSACYYLNGEIGEIKIKTSGVKDFIKAGIDDFNNVWSQIPHLLWRRCYCNA